MKGQKTALILGTAQFDPTYGVARTEAANPATCDFLTEAHRLGYTALDTAPSYSEAQEVIGRCGWAGGIHSKISAGEDAVLSLANTLRNLGRDNVDVAYFHDDRIVQKDKTFFEQTVNDISPVLAKRVGVSVYSAEDFEKALEIKDIRAIQVPMSVIDQRITDAHLSQARESDTHVFARSIFLQGALLASAETLPPFLGQLRESTERIRALSQKYARPILDLLIGFVRDRSGVDGLVVGAESISQLQEIAQSFASPLLPDTLIDELRHLKIDEADIIDPRTWGPKRPR